MLNVNDEQKLLGKIAEYENIIIAKHTNPDWDAQGSALGLKEIIKDNFKNKNVYVVGTILNSKEKFDDHILNEDIISKSLLITVDVANSPRIDFEYWDKTKEIFKIDHHIKVDNFGNNDLVDETSIACTQVLTLWANHNNLKISKKAAEYLYFGLTTDSGRFLFGNTSAETFEAAKILISTGIVLSEIYDKLYIRKLELANWHNYAFSKKTMVDNYPIGYIKMTKKDYENYNLSDEEFKSALSVLGGIDEIEIHFMVYEDMDTDQIKVSLRSRKYNINKIAVLYNGGGHKLASGAKLNDWTQLEKLIEDLKGLVNEGE